MEQNNEKIIVRVDPDLEELIPGFLQRRHEDIVAIADALKKDDYETVRILGHSMKGSGGGYGFDAISNIGRIIEQAAKDKNLAEIQKQAHELSTYLGRIEIRYH